MVTAPGFPPGFFAGKARVLECYTTRSCGSPIVELPSIYLTRCLTVYPNGLLACVVRSGGAGFRARGGFTRDTHIAKIYRLAREYSAN